MSNAGEAQRHQAIPSEVAALFWDYGARCPTWPEDRDLIISRVLTVGSWDAIRWLRTEEGGDGLREWIQERQGRGLDARRLRFWELLLHLRHAEVSGWIRAADGVWAGRTVP